MQHILTIVHKEFIHIVRDPKALSLVLVMPVTLLLLLGYAVAVEIENIPTAVYDQDKSSESRDFWSSSGIPATSPTIAPPRAQRRSPSSLTEGRYGWA